MIKLILKKLSFFLYNPLSILGNIKSPASGKKNLLQKKRDKVIESFSFEKRSPQSNELQRKLALLVSNIDKIDKRDIKGLEHRKYEHSSEDDFLNSYRIDFHNKDEIETFKEKYKDYLL